MVLLPDYRFDFRTQIYKRLGRFLEPTELGELDKAPMKKGAESRSKKYGKNQGNIYHMGVQFQL